MKTILHHCDLSREGSNKIGTRPLVTAFFCTLGWLWVCLGLVLNEWVVPVILGIDPLGPTSLMLTRVLNVTVVSWGLCTLRWPTNNIVQGLNLTLCLVVVILGSTETTFRLFPTILGHDFANGILTKYHTKPGGIYYYDPTLRMLFMEPNRTETMYYFGYKWIHQTDEFGFRNPKAVKNANVVLLGDSFIYGHGVSVKQTVAYFIEKLSGLSVFNLGQQGDSALEQSYKLTEYLRNFAPPQYFLYFFYENDITDLWNQRTEQELIEFINTPIEQIKYRSRADVTAAIKARDDGNHYETHVGSLYVLLKQRSYLLKVFDWLNFVRQKKKEGGARTSTANRDINDENSTGWRYTLHAILYMNYIARIHGSQFYILPITPDNKKHYTILEKFARARNLNFVDTERIDRANKALFLERDGHFNENGALTMANIVVNRVMRVNK